MLVTALTDTCATVFAAMLADSPATVVLVAACHCRAGCCSIFALGAVVLDYPMLVTTAYAVSLSAAFPGTLPTTFTAFAPTHAAPAALLSLDALVSHAALACTQDSG
jgi:hypothetical protein